MSDRRDIPEDVKERFWARVQKGDLDDCWEWTGTKDARGYGSLGSRRATHLALAIAGKPRPAGASALHSCDNPPCCNPGHLRWGTDAENVADMVSRGRHHAQQRTECIHGHPLSGNNLIVRKNGQRRCRTCQNAAAYRYDRKPEALARKTELERQRRRAKREENRNG